MRKKKILEICLQHDDDVKKAVEFNKKNNYEYILKDDNNLINYNNLAYLLRIGYVMSIYADTLTLTYKTYNFDDEKVEDE